MEGGGRKPTGSSLSNDLFGPPPKGGKDSSVSPATTATTGIFDSVFSPPPPTYSRSEVIGSWRKKDSENQGWNPKQDSSSSAPGYASQASEGQSQGAYNKGRSSIFQDHKVEPHYLSSSIYYGGQDVYTSPSDTRSSVSPHTKYKKDGEDDDPNGSNLDSASRGNWWQGGVYY